MLKQFLTAFSFLLCFSNYTSAENNVSISNEVQLVSDWQGILERFDVTAEEHVALFLTGKSEGLRLVFHITKTKDGYASTIDSLDQGAKRIPTETTVLDGNNLLITSPIIGAEFRAIIMGDKITGT
jgi:hypothetical protein